MKRSLVHRTATGRSYQGHVIHAAPGVHEYAARLCVNLLPGKGRILEIGSGTGALTLRLRELSFEVTPTDLQPLHSWIHALDLDNPQWTDATAGSFDLFLCIETLEHVENPRSALRSLRLRMRKGDRIVVSTPNISHPHSKLKMLLTGAPFIFGPDHYYETGHITILPDWLLSEHLRQAGFSDLDITTAGDFEYEGARRIVHLAEMGALSALGVRHRPTEGAGVCTFITACAA